MWYIFLSHFDHKTIWILIDIIVLTSQYLLPDYMDHQTSLVDINKTLISISLYDCELIHS